MKKARKVHKEKVTKKLMNSPMVRKLRSSIEKSIAEKKQRDRKEKETAQIRAKREPKRLAKARLKMEEAIE